MCAPRPSCAPIAWPISGYDRIRIFDGRERNPEDTVSELLDELGGHLEREARLPRAARPRERDESGLLDQRQQFAELAVPADQRARLSGQVRLVEAAERRKVALSELVEPEWLAEILEAVLAEVAELGALQQALRRLGEDDLAAVSGRADACGAVHVQSDVALGGDRGLARVDAHAHRDLQLALCFLRGGDSVGCARECGEEGVALRIHFHTAVARQRLAQDAAVLLQECRVRGAVLLQQSRGPLDVGEQEGDGTGRKVRQAQY